jgi:penicillin-binding protein 1A
MSFSKNNSFFQSIRSMKLNKLIILITLITGVLFGFILVLIISTNNRLLNLHPPKMATIIYDVNNKEYSRLFVENRLDMPLQKIPDLLKKAVINVEDNRYYEHSGIDFKAIGRAIWVDLRGGGYIEGGSTITQQLARNVLLTQKKAITRKIQEVFLAISIERNYTKDEILERYLNQICFGHGTYGVEAASRFYFGKSATELQLHQIALLAGIPKNPTGYSPYQNPNAAKERRTLVLDQMVKYGSITMEQAEAANKTPLDVIPLSALKRRAPFFVDYIIQRLHGIVEEDALRTGGYSLYTTIDPDMQQAAEEAVAGLTGGKPDTNNVIQPQMCLVAIDPRNGYIKAMVGGRDYSNTQLNRATSNRQPGSTMKPFVYTAAIDSREFTPSTIMVDEELKFNTPQGEYKPTNYDKIFRGEIPLRSALENSINIIAIKLVDSLGASRVIKYARQMGLKSLVLNSKDLKNDLNYSSLALGGLTNGVTPIELASAYTPLANQGIYADPIAILEVKDSDGNTIFSDHPHKQVAIPEATAYLVTDMLKGVIIRGTGRAAMLDRPAAGKTGTTSNNTNAWFVGYTPDLLATVWIGNDAQNTAVKIKDTFLGSGTAAGIWGIFMGKALANTPASDFIVPPGIVSNIEICPKSGELATPNCPEIVYETYLAGTEPTVYCYIHQDGAVDEPSPTNGNMNNNPTIPQPSSTPTAQTNLTPTVQATPTPPTAKKKMVVVKICAASGLLATDNCPPEQVTVEMFVEGEEPTAYCNVH